MSDAGKREWRFYLDDRIEFSGKVLTYTDGLGQAGFVASGLTYDATPRNLEMIGEAATHIPDEFPSAPFIPAYTGRTPRASALLRCGTSICYRDHWQ